MISPLLDDVLDRTVVAGLTNVGYRIRRRGWDASDLRPMPGKVVLLMGASSGLGFAAAEGFARLDAAVWLVVRNPERGEQARAGIIERSGNRDVHVGLCDLIELASVRQFAGRFRDQASRLDVLVNNAGVMTEARRVSGDGIELTLATNVVGPFLLTNLLLPLVTASAPARVINVSSGGQFWLDRRPRPTNRLPWTRETRHDREQLLAECGRLSGLHDAPGPTAPTSIPEGES